MSALPCTTVAGRHAAELARSRDRNLRRDLRDSARERLAEAFKHHGLPTKAHFQPELEDERTLFVDCRVASHSADQQLINAIMDEQGWTCDAKRLSRVTAAFDVRRVRHAQTDARLAVIIKTPTGEVVHLEAA